MDLEELKQKTKHALERVLIRGESPPFFFAFLVELGPEEFGRKETISNFSDNSGV